MITSRALRQHFWSRLTPLKLEGGDRTSLLSSSRHIRRQRAAAQLERKPVLWLERFPVTILLAIEYGAFVVHPALQHHTQPERLIIQICVVAMLIAFSVEGLLLAVPHGTLRPVRMSPRSASTVFVVGAVASGGAALAGRGSYAVQIGSATGSRWVSLFSPFTPWMLFGVLLHLYLFRAGIASRSRALAYTGVGTLVQLGLSIRLALFDQLLIFLFPVTVGLLLSRILRLRSLVIVATALPLLLPPLYHLRNERRIGAGALAGHEGSPTVASRFRFDLQMGLLQDLPPPPASIGVPTIPTLLRFGLLPRVIDSSRPNLTTGETLSVALGGSPTNSASLTPLGEAYAFSGWQGLIVAVGLLTLGVGVAIRRRSAWAFVFLGVLVANDLTITSSYPNLLASTLATGEAMVAAMIFCRLKRRYSSELHPPNANTARRSAWRRDGFSWDEKEDAMKVAAPHGPVGS